MAKSTFRRHSRRTRRSGSKRTRFGRKRTHRKRSMRSSSSKQGATMKDRSFIKFKYTTLTATPQINSGASTGIVPNNGQSMIPASTSGLITPNRADMYYFVNSYDTNSTGIGPAYGMSMARFLPGNSIAMVDQANSDSYFSDQFEQQMPTGVSQWSSFYNRYFCHGSAVEVTLTDTTIPGQLVVLPVLTGRQESGELGSYQYDYNYSVPNANMEELTKLLQFQALPDDQPYARIKFVSSAGGMDRVRIKHKMLTKKLYDVKKLTDDQNNSGLLWPTAPVGGTFSPNIDPPQRGWVWFIAFIPAVSQVTTGTPSILAPNQAFIQVKITYFCELTERVTLNYEGAF